jgi:hypothetical protein
MPFSTDVNWPQGLLNIFDIGRTECTLEARYNGAYDRLFNYAFEDSFAFFLDPQLAPEETPPCDDIECVRYMAVLNNERKPVLIAQIQDDGWVDSPLSRRMADKKMRLLYNKLSYKCPIRSLYGLSLLGTSLRVYCADTVTGYITPQFVGDPDMRRAQPRNVLEGQWDLDILSKDGLVKMQEIVAYIKGEAANAARQ